MLAYVCMDAFHWTVYLNTHRIYFVLCREIKMHETKKLGDVKTSGLEPRVHFEVMEEDFSVAYNLVCQLQRDRISTARSHVLPFSLKVYSIIKLFSRLQNRTA